jgi:hypothetical protein
MGTILLLALLVVVEPIYFNASSSLLSVTDSFENFTLLDILLCIVLCYPELVLNYQKIKKMAIVVNYIYQTHWATVYDYFLLLTIETLCLLHLRRRVTPK